MNALNLGSNEQGVEIDQLDVRKVYDASTAFYAVAIFSVFGILFLSLGLSRLPTEQIILEIAPSIVMAILFIGAGYFTRKFKLWALIIGISIYGLDTILLIIQMLNTQRLTYGVFLRFLILFYLVRGFLALLRLKEVEKEYIAKNLV